MKTFKETRNKKSSEEGMCSYGQPLLELSRRQERGFGRWEEK
jgi:hypothetical protein